MTLPYHLYTCAYCSNMTNGKKRICKEYPQGIPSNMINDYRIDHGISEESIPPCFFSTDIERVYEIFRKFNK